MPDAVLSAPRTAGVLAPCPTRTGRGGPLLAARKLCFDTGGQRLIHDIDITTQHGRRLVIMGANGSGKTLLLRLLHGLLTPSAGTVEWQGDPLDRAARRHQAMVFQRPVMMRRSVAANLRFALSVRGLRGSARRAREEEALSLARLAHLRDKPARVLSGGEQQRLALARALACRPRMLLLDEPTAHLDPGSTHAIEDLISAAHTSGVSTIMVTHDIGQARRMGDDLVFLHEGRVAESGPLPRLLDNPRSVAARAWLEGRILPTGSRY
jgi:tungstate transport system ATP-binding protein